MSEIVFSCPWCDQRLEAPADMISKVIQCPACRKEFCVPDPPAQQLLVPPPLPKASRRQRLPMRWTRRTSKWAAIGIVFASLISFSLFLGLNSESHKYNRALAAYKAEKYEEAIDILEKLPLHYRESELMSSCKAGIQSREENNAKIMLSLKWEKAKEEQRRLIEEQKRKDEEEVRRQRAQPLRIRVIQGIRNGEVEGALCSVMSEGQFIGQYRRVFVSSSKLSKCKDDEVYNILVEPSGIFEYRTVLGAMSRIDKVDFVDFASH